MKRANWIGAPAYFNLNHACRAITEAYGHHLYLVGSALERRDYRDVDLRLILPDEEFDQLFPGIHGGGKLTSLDARWSLTCASISLWLSARTKLPVDFQIQRRTEANAQNPGGARHPIGLFVEPGPTSLEGA